VPDKKASFGASLSLKEGFHGIFGTPSRSATVRTSKGFHYAILAMLLEKIQFIGALPPTYDM